MRSLSCSLKRWELTWYQLYHHWWHWRLSWQPPVPPMMTKLASWYLCGFSDYYVGGAHHAATMASLYGGPVMESEQQILNWLVKLDAIPLVIMWLTWYTLIFYRKHDFVFDIIPLQWCHHECTCMSNNWHLLCFLNRSFRRRSKKISKLRVTGPCEENPLVTSGFPSQRPTYAENISVWWCQHALTLKYCRLLKFSMMKWKDFLSQIVNIIAADGLAMAGPRPLTYQQYWLSFPEVIQVSYVESKIFFVVFWKQRHDEMKHICHKSCLYPTILHNFR